MFHRIILFIIFSSLLTACAGYYDMTDDYKMAIRDEDRGWYEPAARIYKSYADKGDCDGQWQYARMIIDHETDGSLAEAVSLVEKSANQGNLTGQFLLADMYYQRKDQATHCNHHCEGWPKRNLAEAYKWYLLAEKRILPGSQGEKELKADLTLIRADMTAAEKQKGEAMAMEWQPFPQQCQVRPPDSKPWEK
jgi:hypothetical protein